MAFSTAKCQAILNVYTNSLYIVKSARPLWLAEMCEIRMLSMKFAINFDLHASSVYVSDCSCLSAVSGFDVHPLVVHKHFLVGLCIWCWV